MPSYLTGINSRVHKPTHVSSLRRTTSSPFATAPRIKPVSRTKSLADVDDDALAADRRQLDATGSVLSVIEVASVRDVLSAVKHCRSSMFSSIPERAGMNSTMIAEVLNYQKNMPPVATLAHVHAFLSASSKTERQISDLLERGELRKIRITGRGNDISGTGDVLVATADILDLMHRRGVAQEAAAEFIVLLGQHPRVTSIPAKSLPRSHITALARAGFLVTSSLGGQRKPSLAESSAMSMPSLTRAHSGPTTVADGEVQANLAGLGSARRRSNDITTHLAGEVVLSLPGIGSFVRNLSAGREYLLDLLGKAKYREAPLYLLRERWDGAVDNDGSVSTAKRIRGEFSEILPARTKKWKKLHGLRFDWALEECLGAGLIELFETKSVGLGVRATV